jgi:cytochrome c553
VPDRATKETAVRPTLASTTRAILTVTPLLIGACAQPAPEPAKAPPAAPAPPAQSPAERGKYLVSAIAVCDDCHTPKTFGPQGPTLDMTRRLSGHPSSEKALPKLPAGVLGPDKFGAATNNHLTAWVGPWGTSYTMNLTPDKTTGLGSWTAEMFIKAIRTGKHQGEGRQILPPMPWEVYSQMNDDDLKAIWAFLQTLPPIQNAIPEPVPPAGAGGAPPK